MSGNATSKLTVSRQAVENFGLWIASGMHAGEVLSLDDVARQYELQSRATTRDVCLVLQAMGLIAMQRGVGVTVQPLERWQLYDPQVMKWRLQADYYGQRRSLTELRLAMEPQCSRLAAQRATSTQRSQLRALGYRLHALGTKVDGEVFDRAAYLEVDQRLHQLQLTAAGNEMFLPLGPAIDLVLDARMDKDFPRYWPEEVALLLHIGVVEAINQERGDVAAVCMTAILHEVKGKIDADIVARVKQGITLLDLSPDLDLRALEHAAA